MTIRLKHKPAGLEKVELPGGTCWCVPANTVVWEAARSYADHIMRAALEGSEALEEVGIDVTMLPDLADPHVANGFRRLLFVQALAGTVIKRWEGVEHQEVEDGPWLPSPPTRLHINALMMIHTQADAFIDRYSRNFTARFSEGNGSRLSLSGTPAGEPNTAAGAKRSKKRAQKDGGAKTAGAAHTSKTRRQPKKAPASGG